MSSFPYDQWLKDTIPGLITLGAIGSIMAVFTLKLCKLMLKPFYQRFLRFYVTRELESALSENYVLGQLSNPNRISILGLYIIYHLQRFVLTASIAIVALLILFYNLSVESSHLTVTNLVMMIVLMLCVYRIVRIVVHTALYYRTHVSPLYPQGKKNAENNKDQPNKSSSS